MPETTTITVRVSLETKTKLDRVASIERRSRSFVAAEAIEQHVSFQLSIFDAVDPDEMAPRPTRKKKPARRAAKPHAKPR